MTTIKRIIKLLIRLNLIKTLYINFKTQSLGTAFLLPIFVYGRIQIKSLQGSIELKGPISIGMIQFGYDVDGFSESSLPIKLSVSGILRFNGPAIISGGSNLTVWSGVMDIGGYCVFGSGITMKCIEEVKIGELTRFAAKCTIMDTNVHFIRNVETGEVKKSYAPIYIGKYCWINYGTAISKGTVIPDYCIIARNSYLSKDYSLICPPASLLAGSPAKVKMNNIQRIFSRKEEDKILKYFKENEDKTSYFSETGLINESEDMIVFFKP